VIVANETVTAVMPDEARIVHKVRMRIIPFVFLLYIISFLDRINIGFAALTMNKELAITAKQFGLVAGIFFFGYFLFEIPSNLLLHKLGARIWIARILITWGILATFTGLVNSVPQLYAVRFLLGLAEAGYFPGIALYLTYWFRQRDQAQAIALFLAGIPVTSILGAPVSGFILDHVHWLNVSSWRWLLILEGIPAVVGGVLTYFLLPSRPAEAKFLTNEEKDWIEAGLAREEQEKLASHKISAVQALMNRRIWHLGLIGFTLNTGEVTIERILQYFDRTFGDDSASHGTAGDGDGLAKLRSQAGTEISCGDSCHCCRSRFGIATDNSFRFSNGCAFVVCCSGHLQRVWPFLLAAGRFPDGVCGGVRDCPGEFACELGRICRTVRDRMDQPEDGQLVWWPGSGGRFVVCIGDADVAASEKAARERGRKWVRGLV
jgi:hypothetical protein